MSSPILLATALISRIFQGKPVLFVQERAGKRGVPIHVYKFRTMRDADDSSLSSRMRVTPMGRILRATSIDELPQLINVLRGDMSLVGPRPLYLKYISRYSERQLRRLDMRPGLTGLAQVRGRNAVSWEDRLEFDVKYVDGVTLRDDIRILWQTVWTVLGIGSAAGSTAPSSEFLGNPGTESL